MSSEHPRIDSITHVIHEEMTRWSVPGVSVGVWSDGAFESAAFGTANVETGAPVVPETLFQIGSISKLFTTTLLITCIERGELELDKPVIHYVPDLPLSNEAARDTITLRHLVTHMGGFYGDNFEDFGRGADALRLAIASYGKLEQQTAPGELWSYCNAGFDLAGRAMEIATGHGFEELMRERVFAPLKMERATYFPDEAILHSVSAGHETDEHSHRTGVSSPWPIPRRSNPAGGISTNVAELLRFARMHIGDGEFDGSRVISTEFARLMRTHQADADFGRTWGLGWSRRELAGELIVEHNGGTNGFQTRFMVVPTRQFAIAIFINHDLGSNAHRAIGRAALEQMLDLREPDKASATRSAQQLELFAGDYRSPSVETEVSVSGSGLKVSRRTRGNFPGEIEQVRTFDMRPIGDRMFIVDAGPFVDMMADFITDSAGHVTWMRFSGRISKRVG